MTCKKSFPTHLHVEVNKSWAVIALFGCGRRIHVAQLLHLRLVFFGKHCLNGGANNIYESWGVP